MKIPFNKFVLALKLFELEVPVLKACRELELSYNTVHSGEEDLFDKIVEAIRGGMN